MRDDKESRNLVVNSK